ncbi:MAG: bL35 family ribosomal protein [Tepidisphaeraceae bacterium]
MPQTTKVNRGYKPHKSLLKRFKVTGTGKIKRRSGFNSHRRSVRSGNMKRRLGRPFIMFEGHAKNLRRFLGLSKLKPAKVAAERALKAKAETKTETK